MVWIIPNTFIAGTKAKANEVNENFTSAKQFMDNLETEQATNTADILQLEQNKADLNGSSGQRFQVADATNSFDAINKQTLLNLVKNTQEVIKGFVLSKFNDTTVSATAGSCYDSTFEYMITTTTSLSKTQENLGNDAKYYVYVCADKDTGNCELVISLSNTTPELPSGFEYYRQLGYFTTDDEGKINRVISIELDNFANVVMLPDYSRASSKNAGTTYTVTEPGWISCSFKINPNGSVTRGVSFSINNKVLVDCYPWKYNDSNSIYIPVSIGDTYVLSGDTGNITNLFYYFIPFKNIGA